MAPTLRLAKTLWGVPEATDPSKWDALFARIKAEGFEAIEANRMTWNLDKDKFCSLLQAHGLNLICQIHTTGGEMKDGVYQYCTSNKLHDHLASFVKLASECAGLPLKPVLINSHSGHDSWGSGEKAVAFLKQALKMEAALGVPVVHETHRQRLFYSPYTTAELLDNPELASLKINADLSHWCCVCEHVFDASDPRDDWWPEVLAKVAKHCEFIHCRVGHAEGPQVPEPDAPEYKSEVEAHCSWWREIWSAQAARAAADGTLWAEPEFGPSPYLQTLPYTRAPVADLWDINSRVAERAKKEFARAMAGPPKAKKDKGGGAKSAERGKAKQGGGGGGVGGKPISSQGGSLLDLATKEAAKEERAAMEAAKAREKLVKGVVKEGGKKGVEIEGASDMGGLDFFCTTMELPEGDVELLSLAMDAMNAEPDPEAEDRKGCSGHVGKMIFSAGVEQLALVAYVPDKAHNKSAEKVDVAEWMTSVLKAVGGTVMMKPPAPATSPAGGAYVIAVIKGDKEAGKFPLKDKDAAMAAAFSYLRSKGAFPEDNDDDSDEMIFGDDDNLDDYA
jgi:hypothetical protein